MELKQEAFGIEALTISRDGQYLLTSDNGGSVMLGGGKSSLRLWDPIAGETNFKAEGIQHDNIGCHVT